jgi:hypothetical protein
MERKSGFIEIYFWLPSGFGVYTIATTLNIPTDAKTNYF